MATYTREQLETRTRDNLRRLCTSLNITGMSRSRKDECIEEILATNPSRPTASIAAKQDKQPISGIEFTARSIMTKPTARFGDKTTTTIHVSSGASSGNFPVAGRTVKEVGEFLREVLNVDRLSTGLVNGNEVDSDYNLVPGDRLEFLKPAGQKG